MTELSQQIRAYLREVLGTEVEPVPWDAGSRLPAFLVERYVFLTATVVGHPVLFAVDGTDDGESPANVRKHIAQIRLTCEWPVLYVRAAVTSYNRKRLIEHRVPFLVPGNQLYLPELGIDLREHFRRRSGRHVQSGREFRPATQAVFIHALLRERHDPLTTAKLAPLLNYSAMTIGRAFDDLVAAELATSRTVGRERTLTLTAPRRELWTRAQSFLKSPVKGRHFVSAPSFAGGFTRDSARGTTAFGPTAGLSALAVYSMLAEPPNPVVAMSREQWSALRTRDSVVALPVREPDAYEVEVWSYLPRPYRDRSLVDPLSLALCLHPSTDERVEQALEQMLEALPW